MLGPVKSLDGPGRVAGRGGGAAVRFPLAPAHRRGEPLDRQDCPR